MKKFTKTLALLLMGSLFMVSCSDDSSDDNIPKEDAKVYITDAPIDNANVEAVFVTVTDVKIDGNSLQGFQKTTINISSLNNGKTEFLGDLEVAARSYSSLTLVLDYETDADGNAPGSYVLTKTGEKKALTAPSSEVYVKSAFDIVADAENEIVIDFDLRKTIVNTAESSSDFTFVTMSEFENGIRVVNTSTTSTISGTAADAENTSDKIIVYAYKKGAFNMETETSGQGESNVMFANAVSSSVVNKMTGAYNISFLNEGEYELHFASYSQNETSGEFEFSSMLNAEALTALDLLGLQLESGITLNVNVKVSALVQ